MPHHQKLTTRAKHTPTPQAAAAHRRTGGHRPRSRRALPHHRSNRRRPAGRHSGHRSGDRRSLPSATPAPSPVLLAMGHDPGQGPRCG
jgi:hypothetical protein